MNRRSLWKPPVDDTERMRELDREIAEDEPARRHVFRPRHVKILEGQEYLKAKMLRLKQRGK